jgi:hypothetical protein
MAEDPTSTRARHIYIYIVLVLHIWFYTHRTPDPSERLLGVGHELLWSSVRGLGLYVQLPSQSIHHPGVSWRSGEHIYLIADYLPYCLPGSRSLHSSCRHSPHSNTQHPCERCVFFVFVYTLSNTAVARARAWKAQLAWARSGRHRPGASQGLSSCSNGYTCWHVPHASSNAYSAGSRHNPLLPPTDKRTQISIAALRVQPQREA